MISGCQGQAIDGACIIANALPISTVQLVLVVSDNHCFIDGLLTTVALHHHVHSVSPLGSAARPFCKYRGRIRNPSIALERNPSTKPHCPPDRTHNHPDAYCQFLFEGRSVSRAVALPFQRFQDQEKGGPVAAYLVSDLR